MPAEVSTHIQTISPFRRGSQPKKDAGPNVLEQSAVAGCFRVMEFIDHDKIVEIRRGDIGEVPGVVALYGNKEMIQSLRTMLADE